MKHHIYWFNGTSETVANNDYLFNFLKLTKVSLTSIEGWGVGDLKQQASGVKSKSEISKAASKLAQEIEKPLMGKYPDWWKSGKNWPNHLVVGGFSRGAAFFVPYFLQKLSKLPANHGSLDELTVLLIDPVSGSKDENDTTFKTLDSLKIGTSMDKLSILKDIKNKYNCTVNIMFISCAFDLRAKNFFLDKTFFKIDKYFFNRKVELAQLHLDKANLELKNKSDQNINKKIDDIKKEVKELEKLDISNLINFSYHDALGISHGSVTGWSKYKYELIKSFKLTKGDKEDITPKNLDKLPDIDKEIFSELLDLITSDANRHKISETVNRLEGCINQHKDITKQIYSSDKNQVNYKQPKFYVGGNKEKNVQKNNSRNFTVDETKVLIDFLRARLNINTPQTATA